MDRTVRDIVLLRYADHGLRPSLLGTAFASTWTLERILSDPEGALNDLTLTPRVGAVTVARIRQVLMQELQRLRPAAWSEAHAPLAPPPGGDAARIARFLRVWQPSAESMPLTGTFHPDFQAVDNEVLTACLVAARPFLYVCISIPEILKTPAVLFCEQGTTAESKAYASRLRSLRQQDIRLPHGSTVLLDAPAMDDLARRSGRYSVLQASDIRLQLQILADFLLLGDGLMVRVSDLRKSGLSSGFMVDGGPLYHYCFGGYAEIRSEPLLDLFRQRIGHAVDAGTPLDEWLRQCGHAEVLAGQV